MTDFDYDCLQKKRIARSSKNHVNARRGKCKLPHEYMSRKELKALNGEVKTYDLGRPMDLTTFRGLPEDLKKQYIEDLQERFHANDRMLGSMLGCSAVFMGRTRKSLGVKSLGTGAQGRPSGEQLAAWQQWITPEFEEPENEDVITDDNSAAVVPHATASVTNFRVSFGSVHSWEELYALCKGFPFPERPAQIGLEVW